MRTIGNLVTLAVLIADAVLLSGMQAWAFAPGVSRLRRHLVAWVVGSLGLALPVLALFTLGAPGPAPGEVLQTVVVLAAITAAIALGVGSWVGRKLSATQATGRQRAFALFWPHVVMLAVLGTLDVFVLYVIGLGRIH